MDHDLPIDDERVEQFELAWKSRIPVIEEFVPESSAESHLGTLLELVVIDLEFRWKRAADSFEESGDRPESTEDYLSRFPSLQKSGLIEHLIAEEFSIRRRYGDRPSTASFIARFPAFRLQLEKLDAEHPVAPAEVGSFKTVTGLPVISGYSLVDQIGEGGMGNVYLAKQEEPIRRHVAVKVIRSNLNCKDVIARFEAERQALAMMDHSNIARVYDAGTTDQGQPFFAMEFVDGAPITEYCKQRRLSLPDRLQIFCDVCSAVQHAHQKAILHRDLKPTNVLITEHDGRPIAKVIDFGLAKAVDSSALLTDKTLYTQAGQVLGTLKYMSPEQATAQERDVDTRADVYALGVILYELLTGETPLDEAAIQQQGVLSVLEFIRDHEAMPPSAKLGANKKATQIISAERSTSPATLIQSLQGDLDWVVMKALENDRERRYASASSLADDVRRFVQHEPVLARPPSASYRLRKFARKNRLLVASTIVGLTLLLGGITTTALQAIRATVAEGDAKRQTELATAKAAEAERQRREADRFRVQESEARIAAEEARDAARQSQRRANNVLEIVVDSFRSIDPTKGANKDMMAKDVLRVALSKSGERLGDDPLGQALMLNALSRSFVGLGEYQEAIDGAKQSVAIRERELGARHNETIFAMQGLSDAYNQAGQFKEAFELAEKVLKIRELAEPRSLADIAAAQNNLAAIHIKQGDFAEAIALLELSIAADRAEHGKISRMGISATNNLAYAMQLNGDVAAALNRLQALLPVAQTSLGENDLLTLGIMTHMGLCFQKLGQPERAVGLSEKCLEVSQEKLGRTHPQTLTDMLNLATALGAANRPKEAIDLLLDNIEYSQERLGLDHPSVLVAKNNLASIYNKTGRIDEAISLNKELLEVRIRKLGPDHPRTLASMNNLATDYLNQDRLIEAAELLEQALPLLHDKLGATNSQTLIAMINLAIAMAESDPARAKQLLEQVVQEKTKADTLSDRVGFIAMTILGDHYEGDERYADAAELYSQAIAAFTKSQGKYCPENIGFLEKLATTQLARMQSNAAIKTLFELVAYFEKQGGDPTANHARVLNKLVVAQLSQREFAHAEAACRKLLAIFTTVKQTQSPNDAAARVSLASALAGQGKLKLAEQEATAALALEQIREADSARAAVILAFSQASRSTTTHEQASQAFAKLEAALEEAPRYYDSLKLLACERLIAICIRENAANEQSDWELRLEELRSSMGQGRGDGRAAK